MESKRADKELDSLFTNLYGTKQAEDDDAEDLPAVSSKLEGLEELLKGNNQPNVPREKSNLSELAVTPMNYNPDVINRKQRWNNANNCDELLLPIVSLALVKDYNGEDANIIRRNLPKVPDTFSSHLQYREVWTQLFLYETYW